MFKRFFAAMLIVLGVAFAAYAQDNKTAEFIKVKDGEGLQIAVTDYVSSGTTVSLYGVIHVADKDYYKSVQTDLDKFDTVLYEGVKQGTKKNTETKVLHTVYTGLGLVLGLEFQMNGIDYTRKNLVHADITSDELDEKLDGESITPFGQFLKNDQLDAFKPILETLGKLLTPEVQKQIVDMFINDEIRNNLKSQFVNSLGQADAEKQFNEKIYKAIVLDRNEIVINTLKTELAKDNPKKSFAIFYGAAHMPDMEKRLQALGFTKSTKRWKTAIAVKESVTIEEDEDAPPKKMPDLHERAPSHEGKRLNDGKGEVDPDYKGGK